MVFVLDNYDSFTYNLVQYLGELGAEVVVRRNDEVTIAEVDAMHPERIVVSPGPCTPQEAGISIKLIRHKKFSVEGVQFHPESVLTGEGKKLVENFLKQ